MKLELAHNELGYKFVPDVNKSFAENAKAVADHRNPFHFRENPELTAKFIQTYNVVANDIYARLTASPSVLAATESRKQRKFLKSLYKLHGLVRLDRRGLNVSQPAVSRYVIHRAGKDVGQEIDLCRTLARDYEAARPKPASPSNRRGLANIPD